MKRITLLSASLLASLLLTPAIAAERGTHAHSHAHGHESPARLQLNAGKKWPTDAPLREAMAEIRQTLAGSLDAIHHGKLSAAGYREVAGKTEGAVAKILANCQLEAEADAQLHLIVADLVGGADRMAGKAKATKPKKGAEQVIRALDNYARYFDDPGFKPLAH